MPATPRRDRGDSCSYADCGLPWDQTAGEREQLAALLVARARRPRCAVLRPGGGYCTSCCVYREPRRLPWEGVQR